MVIPWAGALLLAAAGLWCWPSRFRFGEGLRQGGKVPRVRRAALSRIGIWVVPALLVIATPVERWAMLASAVMVVGTGLHLFRRGRGARRAQADAALLARAVGMIVREVEAGATPSAAGRAAAAELPSSLAALVLGAVDGDPVAGGVGSGATALGHATEGYSSVSATRAAVRGGRAITLAVERLGTAVSAANRHGIALAGVLTAAAQDLRERADSAERRVSSTAGAVVSGYVLAALPIGGIGLGVAMGADPWSVLNGSALGSALLVVGAALLCAGLLWVDRLVRGRDG